MSRLIKLDKDFLNMAAYMERLGNTPRETLAIMEVLEVGDADASGGEPIFLPDGTPAGRVTSGAYGHHVGKSLALGFIKDAKPGDEVSIAILGRPHNARILHEPPFDPTGERLRA